MLSSLLVGFLALTGCGSTTAQRGPAFSVTAVERAFAAEGFRFRVFTPMGARSANVGHDLLRNGAVILQPLNTRDRWPLSLYISVSKRPLTAKLEEVKVPTFSRRGKLTRIGNIMIFYFPGQPGAMRAARAIGTLKSASAEAPHVDIQTQGGDTTRYCVVNSSSTVYSHGSGPGADIKAGSC